MGTRSDIEEQYSHSDRSRYGDMRQARIVAAELSNFEWGRLRLPAGNPAWFESEAELPRTRRATVPWASKRAVAVPDRGRCPDPAGV